MLFATSITLAPKRGPHGADGEEEEKNQPDQRDTAPDERVKQHRTNYPEQEHCQRTTKEVTLRADATDAADYTCELDRVCRKLPALDDRIPDIIGLDDPTSACPLLEGGERSDGLLGTIRLTCLPVFVVHTIL